MEIRKLYDFDDRLELSSIYERSWRHSYKGIVPQEYLDSIPAGKWRNAPDREGRHTIVLTDEEKLVGTASYGRSRFEDFEGYGELVSLYLLPEYTGKGYGKKLLDFAIKELWLMDYTDVFIWVFYDNMKARYFYEKNGFTLHGARRTENFGGKDLVELAYCRHKQII